MSDDQELIPSEQHTLIFYGKPIIVVRLPDGRPGVVLRFLCENLQIDANAQVQRVQRSEAMAEDLVFTRVETPGGAQRMATLVLRSIAYWFATIDTRRMKKDDPRRMAIVQYQREAVDVLYAWAAAPQVREAPSKKLVSSEPIVEPTRPAADASLAEWHEYYVRMAAVLEWQMEVEAWRGGIENRLEGLEAITGLIPEILERLPAPTITPAHQNKVKYYVSQLSLSTGQHPATIHSVLYTAFNVPRYQELLEAEWERVERWFQSQLDRQEIKAGFGFLWCYPYLLVTYLLPYALLEILTKRHKFILVSF